MTFKGNISITIVNCLYCYNINKDDKKSIDLTDIVNVIWNKYIDNLFSYSDKDIDIDIHNDISNLVSKYISFNSTYSIHFKYHVSDNINETTLVSTEKIVTHNSDGIAVSLGKGEGHGGDTTLNASEIHYCGRKMKQCGCGNCNFICGPTNGCPCNSCKLLLDGSKRISFSFHVTLKISELIKSLKKIISLELSKAGDNASLVTILDDFGLDDFADDSHYTPMHWAAHFGNLETVKLLLDRGSALNTSSNCVIWKTITPLMSACRRGHLEVVRYLVKVMGVEVNEIVHSAYASPLYISCFYGHLEVARYLKEAGADVDWVTSSDYTPFCVACYYGHLEVARYLKEAGANFDKCNSDEGSPLYYSCQNGHLDVVQYLIEQVGADLDKCTKTGVSPFYAACQSGHLEIVKYLREAGADVDKCTKTGASPFYVACQSGHLEVVRYLKEVAKVNTYKYYSKSSLEGNFINGFSGLDIARLKNRKEIVRYLKYSYLDDFLCNFMLAFGACPISCPCMWLQGCCCTSDQDLLNSRNNEMLCKFCQFYYCPHLVLPARQLRRTVWGEGNCIRGVKKDEDVACCLLLCPILCPAVHIAVCTGLMPNYEGAGQDLSTAYCSDISLAIRLFICCTGSSTLCCGIDSKDRDGDTAFHGVGNSGNNLAASVLLSFRPNLNAKNNRGQTCLHKAVLSKNYETAKRLVSEGADLYEADLSKGTPLDYAEKDVDSIRDLVCAYERRNLDRALSPAFKSCCCLTSSSVIPIGNAVIKKLPLFYTCLLNREDELIERLQESPDDVNKKCPVRGLTPLEIACEMQHKNIVVCLLDTSLVRDLGESLRIVCEKGATEIAILLITRGASVTVRHKNGKLSLQHFQHPSLEGRVVVDHKYSVETMTRESSAMWFYLLQSENLCGSHLAVDYYVKKYPYLAVARDHQSRQALDVATAKNREVIKLSLLVHGRYKITEKRPEHASATCLLFKAVDEAATTEFDGIANVALKFMKAKNSFEREVRCRQCGYSDQYVINSLETYPKLSELESRDDSIDIDTSLIGDGESILEKGTAEKLFLLVMPLAGRNLFVAMKQERWAGRHKDKIVVVCRQIAKATEHLHSKGFIHGDLKPLNICRVDTDWKLIDFDACGRIGVDEMGLKYSSAYCPPEAVYFCSGVAFIKSRSNFSEYRVSNAQPLVADSSYDIWSLGCIFYQLCCPTVTPLFQADHDDNLLMSGSSGDDLICLAKWESSVKASKLSQVDDPLARNLLDRMLVKDPSKRIKISSILTHPYLSGTKVARLVGEQPLYDVFISYRVSSDLNLAGKLYDEMSKRSLKVWWDKKCLQHGLDWKEGFITGLLTSRTFVSLISERAISNPNSDSSNYCKLTETSPCDNVLLEQRLALELHQLGMIEGIFPVFIGNEAKDSSLATPTHDSFSFSIFKSVPDIVVSSVEQELVYYMEVQNLGTPLTPNKSVLSVVNDLKLKQGGKIEGSLEISLKDTVDGIINMVKFCKGTNSTADI